MLKRDYIQVIIEDLGRMLTEAIGLKRKGDHPLALSKLEYCYGQLKLTREDILTGKIENIVPYFNQVSDLPEPFLDFLSDLLWAERELSPNNKEEVDRLNLEILEYLQAKSQEYSLIRAERLAALR